jgi:molybdate transport system substrate-binding protein
MNTMAVLLCLSLAMAPFAGRAADLQVLAGGGIAGPMAELTKSFEGASGHKLIVRYGTTPQLIKLATDGGPFDVAVVPREVFNDEAARARFVPGPTIDIARVGLGVAVRSGSPKPDISNEANLKQALLKAQSIATIPASAAGAQVLRLFDRLGIANEVKPRIKAQPGPIQLVQAMAAGEAELGIFLINVLTAPGLEVIGPVPAPLNQNVVFTGSVAADASQAEAAKALLEFLKTPAAQKIFAAKGVTPG